MNEPRFVKVQAGMNVSTIPDEEATHLLVDIEVTLKMAHNLFEEAATLRSRLDPVMKPIPQIPQDPSSMVPPPPYTRPISPAHTMVLDIQKRLADCLDHLRETSHWLDF